jgi:hypothetical protein
VKLLDRPAVDIVVITTSATVGIILILGMLAVILIELLHPQTDTGALIEVESEILGVLVGALVGVIGGRSIGHAEGVAAERKAQEVADE